MAHPHNPFYIDGDFSTPTRISRTPREYPFAQNGDVTTAMYEAVYVVSDGSFTPTARGTVDPENAGFYLIRETKPEITQGKLATFRRTYASVPSTQTVEGSIMVPRPSPGLASYPGPLGSYRVFQPDTTLEKFDAYLAKTVASDTGAPSFYPTGGTYTLTFGADTTAAIAYNAAAATVQTALNLLASITARGGVTVGGAYNTAGGLTLTFATYGTATIDPSGLTPNTSISYSVSALNGGFTQTASITAFAADFSAGTFTLTIFGQTTAGIAYNATAATVQAALNALSEVAARGNCTVTLPGGAGTILESARQISFTINFANAVLSAGSASLTPAGSAATPSITDGAIGRTQKILFTSPNAVRDLYVSAHGLTTADTLFLRVGSGSTYYSGIVSPKFTLPDANTIRLVVAASDSYAAAATFGEVGKRTKANYEPGSAPTLVNEVTRFSLSAITPDTYEGADAVFLQAIFSGDTSINYRVGDSARWPNDESPIRSLTTTQVSAANL